MTLIMLKKLAKQCFEGDIALPKIMFWMAGTICLLAGIIIGLTSAPLTHGVRIGCGNGNNNGNNNGNTGRTCCPERRMEADKKKSRAESGTSSHK